MCGRCSRRKIALFAVGIGFFEMVAQVKSDGTSGAAESQAIAAGIDEPLPSEAMVASQLLDPIWRVESEQGEARLGHAVAVAGDVNGDGFADVIAADPLFGAAGARTGRVQLYLGSAAGLEGVASRQCGGKRRRR
jgi:hypothetical protein